MSYDNEENARLKESLSDVNYAYQNAIASNEALKEKAKVLDWIIEHYGHWFITMWKMSPPKVVPPILKQLIEKNDNLP